jgi:hypothetical protein
MAFMVFGSENRLTKDHVYEIAYGADVGFTRDIHNESNKLIFFFFRVTRLSYTDLELFKIYIKII